ncbi:hypothetical protein IG631_21277 [Alternaria alternata]|nr:hypothetical protein IG631_21277 [Alternaria alternata]
MWRVNACHLGGLGRWVAGKEQASRSALVGRWAQEIRWHVKVNFSRATRRMQPLEFSHPSLSLLRTSPGFMVGAFRECDCSSTRRI